MCEYNNLPFSVINDILHERTVPAHTFCIIIIIII